jgi:hypothetical protein
METQLPRLPLAQAYYAIDDPTRFRRPARRAKRVQNVGTPVLSSRAKFWNFTPKLRTIQADATRAIVSASAFCISSADCANGADRFIHTKIGGPQIYPVPGHQNKHTSDRIFPSTEEATKRRMLSPSTAIGGITFISNSLSVRPPAVIKKAC